MAVTFPVCLQWTGVRSLLPPNVHLLTLQQFPSNGPVPSATRPYLLRLEHIYEVGEDAILSQPAVVSLQVRQNSFFGTDIPLPIPSLGESVYGLLLLN